MNTCQIQVSKNVTVQTSPIDNMVAKKTDSLSLNPQPLATTDYFLLAFTGMISIINNNDNKRPSTAASQLL